MSAKYLFVTGGVVSSVGKGISAASIGRILKSRGLRVSVMKFDPYLNVDPGTMSPYQHGEVFVTKDGGETDMDLGHYERFIDQELTKSSNLTAGQVYVSLLGKERRGDFLGGTIQAVPHVTNEIKGRMKAHAEETAAEVVVVEVGGTVGDIEGLPFLEAIRQMRNEVGRGNVLYIHVTLLPYMAASDELKTKPHPAQRQGASQHRHPARRDHLPLRYAGARGRQGQDIPLLRRAQGTRSSPCSTCPTVYEVPLVLEEYGLGDLLVRSLDLPEGTQDLTEWSDLVDRMSRLSESVPIALVGKYVDLQDSYISVKEALKHAGLQHDRDIEIQWVHSEDIERHGPDDLLKTACGIVVPGGFGSRGVEGMIETARYAREHQIPYLGLCLGLQAMVVGVCQERAGDEGGQLLGDPARTRPTR